MITDDDHVRDGDEGGENGDDVAFIVFLSWQAFTRNRKALLRLLRQPTGQASVKTPRATKEGVYNRDQAVGWPRGYCISDLGKRIT